MGFADVSVFHAGVQNFNKLMAVEGGLLGEVFDKNAFFGVLSDVEFFLFFGFKEVHDLLVIEFKVRAGDETFGVFDSVDSGKELVEGLLHKSVIFADHGVGLAGSSLSIDKDTRVVSVKDVIQELIADVVKNVVLGGRGRKDFIESELVLFELDLGLGKSQYTLLLCIGLYPNVNLDGVLT